MKIKHGSIYIAVRCMLSVPDCVRRGLHCWKVWKQLCTSREVPMMKQMQLSSAQFSKTKGS